MSDTKSTAAADALWRKFTVRQAISTGVLTGFAESALDAATTDKMWGQVEVLARLLHLLSEKGDAASQTTAIFEDHTLEGMTLELIRRSL